MITSLHSQNNHHISVCQEHEHCYHVRNRAERDADNKPATVAAHVSFTAAWELVNESAPADQAA